MRQRACYKWKSLLNCSLALAIAGTVALCSQPAQSQPAPTEPVPTARVRVQIELQNVYCRQSSENGDDEIYFLSAFAGVNYYDSDGIASSSQFVLDRMTSSLTPPISINDRQQRNFGTGRVLFDGEMLRSGMVVGGLRGYEQDESTDWSKRNEWLKSLTSHIRGRVEGINRTPLRGHIGGADILGWADEQWEETRKTYRRGLNPDNDDRLTNSGALVFKVDGPAQENLDWLVKGKDWEYVVRYRVTRTPIESVPSPSLPTS